MNRRDVSAGLVTSGAGAAFVYVTSQMATLPGQQYGPGFFPALIGSGLVAAGLLLSVQAFLSGKENEQVVEEERPGWFMPALVACALLAYILLSDRLGFHLAALLGVLPVMWLFTRRFLRSLVITVIGVVVAHAMFYGIFKVSLPWGVFQSFAW